MSNLTLIHIETLCKQYQVENSFFVELESFGLVELHIEEHGYFIQEDQLEQVEKIIRLHHDLNLNLEGVDTVLNLLKKIEQLQTELRYTKNRLRIYED